MNAWRAYITHVAEAEFVDSMADGDIYQWTDAENGWTCRFKMNRWNDEYRRMGSLCDGLQGEQVV
jgi:hypothetical protein